MAIGKSDSSLIREYSKKLVHALTHSAPARESLAIGLFGKKVLSDLEKQEIMNESGSTTRMADKLVGYIINRIDSQEHCDNIWEELHSVEALTDILKKIKPEGGILTTMTRNKLCKNNYKTSIIYYFNLPLHMHNYLTVLIISVQLVKLYMFIFTFCIL